MSERRTIHKKFLVWEFDKEERWLNEMALSGWALCGVGFFKFEFEKCEPGEYIIRLELHPGDENYLAFMQDTGAECVARFLTWVYFRRKSELGPFDLFSDIDSKIAHLNRIGKMLSLIGAANTLIGIANAIHSQGMGVVNLLCAMLLFYGLGRIHGKKEALEKERFLRE